MIRATKQQNHTRQHTNGVKYASNEHNKFDGEKKRRKNRESWKHGEGSAEVGEEGDGKTSHIGRHRPENDEKDQIHNKK